MDTRITTLQLARLRSKVKPAIQHWLVQAIDMRGSERIRVANDLAVLINTRQIDRDDFMDRIESDHTWTFNVLAKGLACLAFRPGGVSFLGVQWSCLPPPDPEGVLVDFSYLTDRYHTPHLDVQVVTLPPKRRKRPA